MTVVIIISALTDECSFNRKKYVRFTRLKFSIHWENYIRLWFLGLRWYIICTWCVLITLVYEIWFLAYSSTSSGICSTSSEFCPLFHLVVMLTSGSFEVGVSLLKIYFHYDVSNEEAVEVVLQQHSHRKIKQYICIFWIIILLNVKSQSQYIDTEHRRK